MGVPESVVQQAYYDANIDDPRTPPWSSLTPEQRSFYFRACSAVHRHYQDDIERLQRRLLEYDLASAPRVKVQAKR